MVFLARDNTIWTRYIPKQQNETEFALCDNCHIMHQILIKQLSFSQETNKQQTNKQTLSPGPVDA